MDVRYGVHGASVQDMVHMDWGLSNFHIGKKYQITQDIFKRMG